MLIIYEYDLKFVNITLIRSRTRVIFRLQIYDYFLGISPIIGDDYTDLRMIDGDRSDRCDWSTVKTDQTDQCQSLPININHHVIASDSVAISKDMSPTFLRDCFVPRNDMENNNED